VTDVTIGAPPAPDAFAPAALGPITLRNRTIKAATYEGLSRRGRVTRELIDFHRAPAAGGVGMTTVAYCAVAKDGRTDRNQITWQDDALPGLRALTDAVHAEGAAISAQIGHGGPVAEARSNRSPALAPSRRLNTTAFSVAQPATPDDLRRIVIAHAEAARRAEQVGFDAVEVHLGHNYLASAFLSPRLNRRKDEYGGSLLNRARVARDLARAVHDAVGGRLAVVAKLNMEDGARGGLALPESIQVAQWLEQDGTVDALELTAGSSLLNPMYLFRGDAPLRDFAAVMPQPIRLGVRVVGRRILRSYPYQDAYLREQALQVRAAVRLPLVFLGGVTTRPVVEQAMRDGFDFVAMGRALLREPDLVRRMAADERTPSLCTHCNRCMPTNYTGTRCVLVSPASPRSPEWASGGSMAASAATP
jgi:2,4-dienoyl-CoA reductase-like NADH-dependent reductase (Old Yellow Enzyme family)